MSKNESDLRNLHTSLRCIGAVAAIDKHTHEDEAGDLVPAGLLASAAKKLGESQRFGVDVNIDHPSDALKVDAGYAAMSQEYRYVWLKEPLTDEESRLVADLARKADIEFDDSLLSTKDAAKAMGINERRVRQFCDEGRMGRKVGDTWVITPEEIERNRERKAGRPAVAYERRGEWGGYTITKAPTGFVVSCWSARQGELTDAKYLLPYGKLAGGYGRDADLNALHNEGMTVGDYLHSVATETEGVRMLRMGRIVQ